MEFQALVETVQGCNVVPVKKYQRVRASNLHSRVGFPPFLMVPNCGHHFGFNFSHGVVGAVTDEKKGPLIGAVEHVQG